MLNSTPPSRLQRDLLPRATEYLRARQLAPGDRVTEQELCDHLQVSRTPVRAVLEELARQGILHHEPRRGYRVESIPAADATDFSEPNEVESLCFRLAGDRHREILPREVSEADLMRRYGVTRALLHTVLNQLAEIGMAERKPGHGWAFPPAFDHSARQESYALRLLIEPASVLAEEFALQPGWIETMMQRNEAFLAAPWKETASIALFEMNAAFHEGLAEASGNRFFLSAIRQQSRLRRFSNYDWSFGADRVRASCLEHMDILARLEMGQRDVAAALLRRHLEQASTLSPVRLGT
ncbi:GntR family transcriptional regulator [Salipiger thiooxidans]|uniref:GntR family transcriptional regulator n=1 Tax=Salipiger thiooxidans TaxID=282683 RepID=UPI0030F407B7